MLTLASIEDYTMSEDDSLPAFLGLCPECDRRLYLNHDGRIIDETDRTHAENPDCPCTEDVPTDVLPEDHQDQPFGWWTQDFDGPES